MAQRRTHVPHPPSHNLHTISWEHHLTHRLAIVWLLSGPKREETMGKQLPNDMPNEQCGRGEWKWRGGGAWLCAMNICREISNYWRPILEAQYPPKTQNTAFTRTFSRSSRAFLPSSLWHESRNPTDIVQKNLFRWTFLFWVDFPGGTCGPRKRVLPPRLHKLVGEFSWFIAGKFWELWWEFCRIFWDQQIRAQNSGENFRAFFVRNFVAWKKDTSCGTGWLREFLSSPDLGKSGKFRGNSGGSKTQKPPEMPIKQGKTSQRPRYVDWPQIGPKNALKLGTKTPKGQMVPFPRIYGGGGVRERPPGLKLPGSAARSSLTTRAKTGRTAYVFAAQGAHSEGGGGLGRVKGWSVL